MRIYNTLSKKKELYAKQGKKRFFVCGPTVYDYAHIGHARTYLAFDIIVRYLRSQNWQITYIQNITDVDDKIIERAKQRKQSPFKLASLFEKAYCKDMRELGITEVDQYARASRFITEIIAQTETLLKKSFAYCTTKGIYFEVRKFKDYGKLSKQNLNKLRPGWRIEPDPEKRDPLDFALWKFPKQPTRAKLPRGERKRPLLINGEPIWWSPWGWGRPGWHIEDTAISGKFFGPQYEFHGGGEDLKFPHHEAEIAQQEAASGKKPFVKTWLHTGSLTVDGKKMSKSANNFVTIRDFLKYYSPNTLRWLVLAHHYRSPLNYSKGAANQAEQSLASIETFLEKLQLIRRAKQHARPRTQKNRLNVDQSLRKTQQLFYKAMEDDFNTPKAVAALFALINVFQPHLWNVSKREAQALEQFIITRLKIFGIKPVVSAPPAEIRRLADNREKCRVHQQFIQADKLRKKIRSLGYEIEDTPLGPFVKKSEARSTKPQTNSND